ncbi:transposase [Anaerobacillus alkalidiazotrophicus]|uniref:Transposase n=1 Tax=Anaerobacillus alkalidiazotrophicus TaxID=472963 RepID=A0A1S2M2X8_9BACI|nr:transposase [Anaerobacillus alkalidiazotrophicus]
MKELTLLLLYLTSWKERDIPENIRRSWKGYPFEILDELSDQDFISGGTRSKSVYLTAEGIQEANGKILNRSKKGHE